MIQDPNDDDGIEVPIQSDKDPEMGDSTSQNDPVVNEDSPTVTEDEDVLSEEDKPLSEAASDESGDDASETLAAAIFEAEEELEENATNEVQYPEDKIDFRGENLDSLVELIKTRENQVGASTLDANTRTVGTWENLVFRAILEPSGEEMRIQNALADLSPEERAAISSKYKDENGKTLLRTSSLTQKIAAGETKTFTGDEALLAFEYQERGGGFRIPLYNSGITLDVIVPTGNDIQTLITNCVANDRQLGTTAGAHYFAYNDLVYKTQIINFLKPLIVNSSYADWRKKDKLWSIIKLPDLTGLVATLAALSYKDGFDGFIVKCTRPVSQEHPVLCAHTETLKVNIFDLIITRFAAMSKASIDHMVEARNGITKHGLGQIAKYQSDLGLEGERITFGKITFTMRIPTINEHIEAGSRFIADIINEIDGDNTDSRYEQFGLRYIRTFLPHIATVEKKGDNGEVAKTSDARVITRELEKLFDLDDDGKMIEILRKFIDKTQFTYVGYPVTQCPTCGYTADTPSGMWTFDPFNAFFTLAFRYLK